MIFTKNKLKTKTPFFGCKKGAEKGWIFSVAFPGRQK
jgi:hypothetical protein